MKKKTTKKTISLYLGGDHVHITSTPETLSLIVEGAMKECAERDITGEAYFQGDKFAACHRIMGRREWFADPELVNL